MAGLHPGARPGGIDVADDREDGVVGGVPGSEEGAHVVERRRVEVFHRPDRGVVIRVVRRVEMAEELLLPGAVGLVVVADPLLVLDNRALVVEVLLAERVEQRGQPVRLQPDGELQLMRRHGLEEVGAVQPGRAVHRPAGRLDQGDVLRLRDVPAALEHHVLEEMGEAGPAGLLVLAPDVVPDVHRDHRDQVVLADDEAEPVGKPLVGELDGRDWHAGLGAAGRDRSSSCDCSWGRPPRGRRDVSTGPSIGR
jgi:hypothetical protein